jgi:hypothetical protein
MKRGRILLGILVLVGIVALLGSAQGQPPLKCEKCACWKIVSMKAEPDCYKVPGPGKEDFHFSFIVELVAGADPTSSPPCELSIDGSSKTCQYESSSTLPRLDLSGVPVGGSRTFTWPTSGDKVVAARPTSHRITLSVPKYYVSSKCDGTTPVTITLTAHSMRSKLCGGGKICTDTKTLTVNPCK